MLYSIIVSPVFEKPVVFPIRRSVPDDDQGVTEFVAVAVRDV